MVTEMAAGQPHPGLRQLVSRYLGYAQDDVPLGLHRGLPSRHVTLIISLAEPIRLVGMPRPGEPPADLMAPVGGMQLSPALIRQDRFQRGVHVELDPLAVRSLFGIPAAELSEHVVDLADLSPRLERLPERLAEAGCWERRFGLLDEFLLAEAAEAEYSPEVGWAWRRLRAAAGRIRVGTLAGEVGWSRRHFTERFRRELGLSPKQAARVLRFERAGALLRQGHGDLAGLATDCGYYDQAHLTNEWRALAGCPPGVWIAEELPFLQDAPLPEDPR
ncbi:helix-turn-helix domain-containing protein [Amycolatopsis alkalitolerans]|uniref:Helix-turn-helix transcriptional regulator n=1 Tax=Amycolatopsis alkalitolerans TaxID=2547244 RepID=A0A5C4LYP0_9PSEU|nr:AraC family transcriptional regulator [Amycolatopsis alkalitolerans]TNC24288.1 helix-turn-helix transcriptional regulator [Amycolatopsis alkalitolerans]